MIIRKRRAQLVRMEAELAAVRAEIAHARYDLPAIDRDTHTRIAAAVNNLREEIARFTRAAEENQRRVVEVGAVPAEADLTWLSIAFRSPDHALETARALEDAARAAMSGRSH
jgi:hypothetical protein